MFKLHNPSNRYVLNLEDAYERAICLKLLNIAATSSYYAIDDMRYKPLNSNNYESIVLKQSRYTLPENELDDEQCKFKMSYDIVVVVDDVVVVSINSSKLKEFKESNN